ncbi:MAG: DUF427 domain-containing protein [Pseudomonadota bacterium]
MWKNIGAQRPAFALEPGPGQESVWDYPRPPVLVPDPRLIEVYADDSLLISTRQAYRVLETASPPTFYLPPEKLLPRSLVSTPGRSFCEWKGEAVYWALEGLAEPVAWSYPEPSAPFQPIRDYLGFYPGRVRCFVAGERVRPQPGGFYGGWITEEIVGPVKGEPGTGHW